MPHEIIVVFGGGSPSLADIHWELASSGSLGLNNSGDTVTLKDAANQMIDQIIYGSEGGRDQSLARFPEGDGDEIVLHQDVEGSDLRFSPGFFVGGNNNESPAVPEPASLGLLGLGLIGIFRHRRKNKV